MLKNMFSKYKMVYSHLWSTYGQSWLVRLSYIFRFFIFVLRFAVLPVASGILITKLSIGDYKDAKWAAVAFIIGSSSIGLLTPLTKYIGMVGENKVYEYNTGVYFLKLINSDIDYFNSNLSGYLTTATKQYVDESILLVRDLRDRYMGTIVSILLPLLVVFWFDAHLGLVMLLLGIIQTVNLFWASNKISVYRKRTREIYKKNAGYIADIITNILVVKSSASEIIFAKNVEANAHKESNIFTQRHTLQSKLLISREIISVIFFLLLLWLAIHRVSEGYASVIGAVLAITYSITILTGIYNLTDELESHDDHVDKIMPAFEILGRKNRIEDPVEPVRMSRMKGDIKFENVFFAYNKDHNTVFENFSLEIPHGQKIGIVGLSGAGKSTLTKLLLRFNDVSEGRITVDGVDIRKLLQSDLRSNIAYVSQEPILFHSSIRQNIILSRSDVSEEDINNALEKAHAWDFVNKLPDKINSVVGERGVKLSGGQKQRIAIARAVLQHAPIMILDEATSALDSESEQIIKDSFKDILKGKTAIVVAHRLSTLSDMDRIIVIDDGKLVEDGTHRELLLNKGLYARLWHRQQKNIETDG